MERWAWKKGETRHKAREAIMFYVLAFCTTSVWPDRNTPALRGFTPEHGENKAKVGDLVLLESIRGWTKWNIGWLRDIKPNNGWPTYVIESLEDGELCNWSNVGIAFMPRDELASHPSWRWSDRQHAFAKRWDRVCYKKRDAYIVLPLQPDFGEGYAVTLGTRTRFSLDDIRPTRTFPDWRKVTKAMMAQCYEECAAERDQVNKERRDTDGNPKGDSLTAGAEGIAKTTGGDS